MQRDGETRRMQTSLSLFLLSRYLGVVLAVPRVQRDALQVEATVEVDGRDGVLELRDDAVRRAEGQSLSSCRCRRLAPFRRCVRGACSVVHARSLLLAFLSPGFSLRRGKLRGLFPSALRTRAKEERRRRKRTKKQRRMRGDFFESSLVERARKVREVL